MDTVGAFTKSKYLSNYGDELNHLILRHFAGTPVINCYGFQELKHFMLIGSVLAKANENLAFWGQVSLGKEAISRGKKSSLAVARIHREGCLAKQAICRA